ncbi:Urea carboxylase-related aminomethyltransferase [Amycolatopsis orientalis]|uniref:Urea carboxylase-related aminomethyltransferase n=1 Tax=Amycolatopsis orientalis TaxID=31958 RepID=A0A193C2U0_AMYOR|nr:urea carboxylase-associated family protein [Amycolatopsis orientalis]ANN18700.1 Urea carboxylase-related aminomethyltransferase [Amycolatopsis orientalis]
MSRTEVPPGTARAVRVRAGDLVRVIDVEGGQVGDVFAFTDSGTEPAEHHSAAHTRAAIDRLFPAIGESFVTDRRRPILTLVEDTSPGEHDMLIPACDPARYAALGAPGHRSCAANLAEALDEIGLSFTGAVPQPINVFMRVPVGEDGRLSRLTASSRPGDAVTLRAELDCVVVLSACPQDLVRISAGRLSPLAIETVHNGGTRS